MPTLLRKHDFQQKHDGKQAISRTHHSLNVFAFKEVIYNSNHMN